MSCKCQARHPASQTSASTSLKFLRSKFKAWIDIFLQEFADLGLEHTTHNENANPPRVCIEDSCSAVFSGQADKLGIMEITAGHFVSGEICP